MRYQAENAGQCPPLLKGVPGVCGHCLSRRTLTRHVRRRGKGNRPHSVLCSEGQASPHAAVSACLNPHLGPRSLPPLVCPMEFPCTTADSIHGAHIHQEHVSWFFLPHFKSFLPRPFLLMYLSCYLVLLCVKVLLGAISVTACLFIVLTFIAPDSLTLRYYILTHKNNQMPSTMSSMGIPTKTARHST